MTATRSFDRDALALLTPEEMARADAFAVAQGGTENQLMATAGQAVADAVRRRWPACPTVVLCGPGNNGGDGYVAARVLAEAGWPVRLGALPGTLKGAAAYHASLWHGPTEALTPDLLAGAELVIDALFGAGLARPITGLAKDVLTAAANSGAAIVAIDVPSGLDGATGAVQGVAVAADLTVTFFRKKPGHLLLPGRQLCGEVTVADIGIPASAVAEIAPQTHINGPGLWLAAYNWPRLDDHKYRRGHVLVSGGAVMTGAARLAARAAGRLGAGLVTLAAPMTAWQVYASSLTSVIVQPISQAADFTSLLADKRRNTVVIGPGAGQSPELRQRIIEVLAMRRSVVLDADALTAFQADPATLFQAIGGACVLTPHEGEFARLFDMTGDKLARAREAARASGAVIVLKGADTVIASPDGRACINENAPAYLAVGGSGDVLAGMIAGLLAQNMEPFAASAAAVWLHGEAGQAAGPGLIAEDLLEVMPGILRGLKALAGGAGQFAAASGRLYRQSP